jgi:hypothetical protein
LHDLERVGRGHEHLGEQRIGIEGDRRDELIELTGIELLRLLLRRARSGLLVLSPGGSTGQRRQG